MAVFKDKTGRGEVNYDGMQVLQAENGKPLIVDGFGDRLEPHGLPGLSASQVVFQLRGEPKGVEDVSNRVNIRFK